jgi:hypothetical protein
MGSEELFKTIEKELDKALYFVLEFKSVIDVFDPKYDTQKQDYKAMVKNYGELLNAIGETDKCKYRIIFVKDESPIARLPIKHKIETQK